MLRKSHRKVAVIKNVGEKMDFASPLSVLRFCYLYASWHIHVIMLMTWWNLFITLNIKYQNWKKKQKCMLS